MKTATITSILKTNNWKAPDGTPLYYHKIIFDNGDEGSAALKEEYPSNVAEGCIVEYELNNGKLKIQSQKPKPTPPKPTVKSWSNTTQYPNKSMNKKHEDFLGFAYGYAKDIMVARINKEKTQITLTDTVSDLKILADEIYSHMGKMLNQDE